MFLARVTGNVVSSVKDKTLNGQKLFVVEPLNVKYDGDSEPAALGNTGRAIVALDVVGAGEGQLVLVVQGSSARMTDVTKNLPADTPSPNATTATINQRAERPRDRVATGSGSIALNIARGASVPNIGRGSIAGSTASGMSAGTSSTNGAAGSRRNSKSRAGAGADVDSR